MPYAGPLAPGAYFGAPVRSDVVNGFLLSENEYRPHQRVPPHQHERAFFYLVLDGTSQDVSRGRTSSCSAHTLVYHPHGETHANNWGGTGGRCLHFEVPPARIESLGERPSALHRFSHYTGGLPVWLAARLYEEFRRPDFASHLAIEGLLLELVATLSREAECGSGRPVAGWLRTAREMIHDRCAERLSVAGMAAELGVHPTHLARAFRRAYGRSVGECVREARLERACAELLAGGHSVSQVAHDVGFCDQSHFSRTFKRFKGMTPSEFLSRFGAR